jgi:tetratricopeptide (TPR) repeat protein
MSTVSSSTNHSSTPTLRRLARETFCALAFLAINTSYVLADAAKDCEQDKDASLKVSACTEFLKTALVGQQPIARYHRGVGYLSLGQIDQAIADLSESVRLKQDLASAFYFRGVAYLGSGRYDAAVADFSEVIRQKPDFVAEAYMERGFARLSKGDDVLAIADFTEAIQRKPDATSAYFGRGLVNEAIGHHEAAISDLTYVATHDTRLAVRAYFCRALAHQAKGEDNLAESDFEQATKKSAEFAMERHWVEYLKSIQMNNNYANWSAKPYDLYLRTNSWR